MNRRHVWRTWDEQDVISSHTQWTVFIIMKDDGDETDEKG